MTIKLTSIAHWNELMDDSNGRPIVVKFSAQWCGPCKVIAPHFHELSRKYQDAMFISIDIDDFEELSDRFEVSSIPYFVLLYQGEIIKKWTGGSQSVIDEISSKLNALL